MPDKSFDMENKEENVLFLLHDLVSKNTRASLKRH